MSNKTTLDKEISANDFFKSVLEGMQAEQNEECQVTIKFKKGSEVDLTIILDDVRAPS